MEAMSDLQKFDLGPLRVYVVPTLFDNYSYLLEFEGGLAVVDPPDAERILEVCEALRLKPTHILNTHAHEDHTAGNAALRQATGCRVLGPGGVPIPEVDETFTDGDVLPLGPAQCRVMATPGHTRADHSLLFEGAVFTGDTLFVSGCGRLFECDAPTMWKSLMRLRELPDDTLVFCGHEYAEENLDFALSLLPDDPALRARREEVRALRAEGQPAVPSKIGTEKAANLFMRADDPAIRAAIGHEVADAAAVFGDLRARRNLF